MVKKEGYNMANEEVKRIVMGLRPIDDECMKVIFKNNNPLAEYVLRIILNRSDLIVEKCESLLGAVRRQAMYGNFQSVFGVLLRR